MTGLLTRVTRIHLTPGPIVHERAFSIEIDDEGGGEFLTVRCELQQLDIEKQEWPALRDAIDSMFENVVAEE